MFMNKSMKPMKRAKSVHIVVVRCPKALLFQIQNLITVTSKNEMSIEIQISLV